MIRWNKLSSTLLPYIIIVFGFAFIYFTIISGRVRSKEINARNRVTNCIISKNAKERSQEDIEVCYRVVERDTGINLIRYDKE